MPTRIEILQAQLKTAERKNIAARGRMSVIRKAISTENHRHEAQALCALGRAMCVLFEAKRESIEGETLAAFLRNYMQRDSDREAIRTALADRSIASIFPEPAQF